MAERNFDGLNLKKKQVLKLSILIFYKKKVVSKPPFPFAMPRGGRRRSETYGKKHFSLVLKGCLRVNIFEGKIHFLSVLNP